MRSANDRRIGTNTNFGMPSVFPFGVGRCSSRRGIAMLWRFALCGRIIAAVRAVDAACFAQRKWEWAACSLSSRFGDCSLEFLVYGEMMSSCCSDGMIHTLRCPSLTLREPLLRFRTRSSKSVVVVVSRWTYRSDSVMSKTVSQVSKPSDTNASRYWDRPNRASRSPRSLM